MPDLSLYARRADDPVLTLPERLAEIQSQCLHLAMTLRRTEQAYAYYQQFLAATPTHQVLLELAADDVTAVFEEDARNFPLSQIRLTLLQWKFHALRIAPLTRALHQLTEQENTIRLAQQTQDTSALYTRCQLCQRYAPVGLVNEPEALLCIPCQILLATHPPSALFFISGRVAVGPDGQSWLKTYLEDGSQLNLSQIMRAGQQVWLLQKWWVSGSWLRGESGEELVREQQKGCHRVHSLASLSGSLLAIAANQPPSSLPTAVAL